MFFQKVRDLFLKSSRAFFVMFGALFFERFELQTIGGEAIGLRDYVI